MPDSHYTQQQYDLARQTEAQLHRFMRHLYTAITSMGDLELTLTPEQKQISERVKDSLFEMNDGAKAFTPLITELGQLVAVLLHQRQTSKEAFMAGWNGFYRDLLSHLTDEDRYHMQHIFDAIMGKDDEEIPF